MTIGKPEGGPSVESMMPPVDEAPPTEVADLVAHNPEELPIEEPASSSGYGSPVDEASAYPQPYAYDEQQSIELPVGEQAEAGEYTHYLPHDHVAESSAGNMDSAPSATPPEYGATEGSEVGHPEHAIPGFMTYQEPTASEEPSFHHYQEPLPSHYHAPDLANYHEPDAVGYQITGSSNYYESHPTEHRNPGSVGYDEPIAPEHREALSHGYNEPVASEDDATAVVEGRDGASAVSGGPAGSEHHFYPGSSELETLAPAGSEYAASHANVDGAPPVEAFQPAPYLYDSAPAKEHLPHDFVPGQSGDFPVPPPFYESTSQEEVAEPATAPEEETAAPIAPKLTMPAVPGARTTTAHKPTPLVPAAFLPRFAPPDTSRDKRGFPVWATVLLSLVCLGLGALGGYILPKSAGGTANANPGAVRGSANNRALAGHPLKDAADELTKTEQDQVDAAFAANKAGNFADAAKLFAAMQTKHPEWGGLDIEIGRAQLYQHDLAAAGATLKEAQGKGLALPDASFLLGLLFMTNSSFPEAEASFAKATALDPTRPDFYYFWGECLRREGKPLEAISKFRAALLRNQYETAEGLYRLKLWLSSIQADQEKTDGTNEQIDAGLTQPRPPMEALFAAAIREIKADHVKDAADLLHRARQLVEPTVFFVILQDPSFVQESWRPELADLYKTDAPVAAPRISSGENSPPPLTATEASAPPPAKPAASRPKGH